MANGHYFEAHVTLDPVQEKAELELLDRLCSAFDFKRANLLMQKTSTAPKDAFCSARSTSLTSLTRDVEAFVQHLKQNNFVVRRYKIESTLIDSRHHDELGLL